MTAPLNSLPKASSELEPDEFELFDLTVTVEGGNFVCRHHLGQGFKVEGEDLVFPRRRPIFPLCHGRAAAADSCQTAADSRGRLDDH